MHNELKEKIQEFRDAQSNVIDTVTTSIKEGEYSYAKYKKARKVSDKKREELEKLLDSRGASGDTLLDKIYSLNDYEAKIFYISR